MSIIGNVVNVARTGVACRTCAACRKWRCSIVSRISFPDIEARMSVVHHFIALGGWWHSCGCVTW